MESILFHLLSTGEDSYSTCSGKDIRKYLFKCASFIWRQSSEGYTTLRPKTRLGKALKILKTILWRVSEKIFLRIFSQVEYIYIDFLKERNSSGEYEHKRLRSAMTSIRYYLPYLHTYEKYPHISIPRTTGICDGYFSHVKEKLKPHRGISRIHRDSLLIFLLEE